MQQRTRRRHRKQDVYDLARIIQTTGDSLAREKIGEYFVKKCLRRSIVATQSAFDDDVRDRAALEYETLFDEGDPNFIPFERAWKLVLDLVRELKIAK